MLELERMKKMVVLKWCIRGVAQGRKGTWAGKLSFQGTSLKKKNPTFEAGVITLSCDIVGTC